MSKTVWLLMLVVGVCLLTFTVTSAQTYQPYSQDELDDLLAPIALYPDPLLAQILPAATYVDQIDDAERSLGGSVDEGFIDRQDWDVSVKCVAHYPEVLAMMDDNRDWTIAVGQVFVQQQDDVFAAVQRLRVRAYQVGTLVTTPQQRVIVANDGTILIVPHQPDRIYVPRYHPQEVYVAPSERTVSSNLISFGLGLLIGAWLNRDCDWHHHRVYYHGWKGGGWIAAARPHVVIVPVYVNRRFKPNVIVVNRTIVERPVPVFRQTIRHDAAINRPVYTAGRRPTTGVFAKPTYGVVRARPAVSPKPSRAPAAKPTRPTVPQRPGAGARPTRPAVSPRPTAPSRPQKHAVSPRPTAPSRPQKHAVSPRPTAPSRPQKHAVSPRPTAPSRPQKQAVSPRPTAPSRPQKQAVSPRPTAPSRPQKHAVSPRPTAPSRSQKQTASPRPTAPSRSQKQAASPRPTAPSRSQKQAASPRPARPPKKAANQHGRAGANAGKAKKPEQKGRGEQAPR